LPPKPKPSYVPVNVAYIFHDVIVSLDLCVRTLLRSFTLSPANINISTCDMPLTAGIRKFDIN